METVVTIIANYQQINAFELTHYELNVKIRLIFCIANVIFSNRVVFLL